MVVQIRMAKLRARKSPQEDKLTFVPTGWFASQRVFGKVGIMHLPDVYASLINVKGIK